MIFGRLVFARQGRARTLGDGLLGERLLLDRDGVGGDHGVFASSSWNTPGAILTQTALPSQRSRSTTARPSVVSMVVWMAAAGFAPVRQRSPRRFVGFRQRDGQSVSVAASSIIMASRFLASSSCRLVISAILRSR